MVEEDSASLGFWGQIDVQSIAIFTKAAGQWPLTRPLSPGTETCTG